MKYLRQLIRVNKMLLIILKMLDNSLEQVLSIHMPQIKTTTLVSNQLC